MQEIIDHSYLFELVDDDPICYKYDFVSEGTQEVPKRVSIRNITQAYPLFYNLGFGDILVDEEGQENINDKARNINKTDGDKILNTAFLCCLDFLSTVDNATIVFFGNTPAKHRLYQIKVSGKLNQLQEYLDVKGAIIENYTIGLDNEGFKEITQRIDPQKIKYEQFVTQNCRSYNFMTLTVKK